MAGERNLSALIVSKGIFSSNSHFLWTWVCCDEPTRNYFVTVDQNQWIHTTRITPQFYISCSFYIWTLQRLYHRTVKSYRIGNYSTYYVDLFEVFLLELLASIGEYQEILVPFFQVSAILDYFHILNIYIGRRSKYCSLMIHLLQETKIIMRGPEKILLAHACHLFCINLMNISNNRNWIEIYIFQKYEQFETFKIENLLRKNMCNSSFLLILTWTLWS